MEKEIWKDINGYEGYYQISNLGRIKAMKRKVSDRQTRNEKVKKCVLHRSGYMKCLLYKGNKYKSKLIHRLVAEAFIFNPENKPQVNHIDSNRTNNVVDNLEWCSSSENRIHGFVYGNIKPYAHWTGITGAKNPNSIPVVQYDKQGNFIAEFGALNEASLCTGINSRNIYKSMVKKQSHAGGFVWMYKQ